MDSKFNLKYLRHIKHFSFLAKLFRESGLSSNIADDMSIHIGTDILTGKLNIPQSTLKFKDSTNHNTDNRAVKISSQERFLKDEEESEHQEPEMLEYLVRGSSPIHKNKFKKKSKNRLRADRQAGVQLDSLKGIFVADKQIDKNGEKNIAIKDPSVKQRRI